MKTPVWQYSGDSLSPLILRGLLLKKSGAISTKEYDVLRNTSRFLSLFRLDISDIVPRGGRVCSGFQRTFELLK